MPTTPVGVAYGFWHGLKAKPRQNVYDVLGVDGEGNVLVRYRGVREPGTGPVQVAPDIESTTPEWMSPEWLTSVMLYPWAKRDEVTV